MQSDAINDLENTLRYSSDEELGKAAFEEFVLRGTRYAHPSEGTVEGLKSITLDDVREFYRRHFTRGSALPGIGGGYSDAVVAQLRGRGPAAAAPAPRPPPPAIEPAAIDGRSVVLVAKPGADASISFGFPIDVHRGERDFYALWIANSWLGEHRNSVSHLYQVIRETRGLNYGDYSYIEAFPEGGQRNMPPVNVGAPPAAVRGVDPHAAERQGRVRAARRAARARRRSSTTASRRSSSSSRARS